MEPNTAYVGPWGVVTGNREGNSLITARDAVCSAREDVEVIVSTSDAGDPVERGAGAPRVLLSGIDQDPYTGEIVDLPASDPPVCQRISDVPLGIYWINTSCPLARKYLDEEDGYGVHSREWRIYHVERYADVLGKIKVSSEEGDLSPDQFINEWEQMQIQMQEAAAKDLAHFIDGGSVG